MLIIIPVPLVVQAGVNIIFGLVMAKTISDRMEFAHESLKDAADEMIMKKLPALGGDGGLIAVDKNGNFMMSFDTDGMYRGYVKSDGESKY